MKTIIPINTASQNLCRTIKAQYGKNGCANFCRQDGMGATAILEIMEEPKPIQVAQIYDQKQNPMNGRVYSEDGISPTLRTPTGGLSEPCILSPIRTEEQRQLRKQGIDTFSGRQMFPRTDGVSDTITTVQKDNLLQEPIKIRQATAQGYIECPPGGGFDAAYPNSKLRRGRVQENGDVVGVITASADGHCVYEGAELSILGYTRDDKGKVVNYHEKGIAGSLHTSTGSGGNTDQFVKEQVIGSMQVNAMRGSIDGVSPCLTEAMGMGGGQIPMVTEASGIYDNQFGQFAREPIEGMARTLKADHHNAVLLRYRIRKLTERECFRLMDVSDSDIDKIEAHRIKITLKNGTVKEKPIPKIAKYKLAGNSIVVSCLYHIFHQMFIAEPPEPPE